jgi:transposase
MESISLTQEERKALIRKMKRETKPSRRLRMHIALLAADGHSPTEIAHVLYCSRTTVYATLRRFRKEGETAFADRERETRPSPQVGGRRPPSLGGLGGGGSALGLWLGPFSLDLPHAGLAWELLRERGVGISRETVRRTLCQLGFVWRRVRPVPPPLTRSRSTRGCGPSGRSSRASFGERASSSKMSPNWSSTPGWASLGCARGNSRNSPPQGRTVSCGSREPSTG